MSQICPSCGNETQELINIDTGMKMALSTPESNHNDLPSQVCSTCYEVLAGSVSRGARLRVEALAKDKNRQMMWKSRVKLVKQARQLMEHKAYAEAAVSYEKYIRVIEMAHSLKPGQLTPEIFSSSSRSKELTVVASTYWDLLRIYDTAPKYLAKMRHAGKKLALFLPHSPLFPDVIKKAGVFQKKAKNPVVVRKFVKSCKSKRSRCFIATSAFLYQSPEVMWLKRFRDQYLKKSPHGRAFVYIYYKYSPAVAQWLDIHKVFKPPVRGLLRLFAFILKLSLKSN